MLAGKKILLGITGSIAAYKSVLLLRLLIKANATVKVIMTPSAVQFVSPLTLATLSNNEVLYDLSTNNEWANHAILARWADIFVIAPVTCNTMAKMSMGLCDNLLLSLYLSTNCPVVLAPAMDEDMWHHTTTIENVKKLSKLGHKFLNVGNGDLASGLIGEGRMSEPETIFQEIQAILSASSKLSGKRVLITAGPTHEAIDPVRFIGNNSSGKMGIAIAEAMQNKGAIVTLVLGPTQLRSPIKDTINVISSDEMFESCHKNLSSYDIIVMAAAVADFKAMHIEEKKIKKNEGEFLNTKFVKTKDILSSLGKAKHAKQILVGFALETSDERLNALNKLKDKNLNLIILNSLNDPEVGFGKETNKITIFDDRGNEFKFEAKSKKEVAMDIISTLIDYQDA